MRGADATGHAPFAETVRGPRPSQGRIGGRPLGLGLGLRVVLAVALGLTGRRPVVRRRPRVLGRRLPLGTPLRAEAPGRPPENILETAPLRIGDAAVLVVTARPPLVPETRPPNDRPRHALVPKVALLADKVGRTDDPTRPPGHDGDAVGVPRRRTVLQAAQARGPVGREVGRPRAETTPQDTGGVGGVAVLGPSIAGDVTRRVGTALATPSRKGLLVALAGRLETVAGGPHAVYVRPTPHIRPTTVPRRVTSRVFDDGVATGVGRRREGDRACAGRRHTFDRLDDADGLVGDTRPSLRRALRETPHLGESADAVKGVPLRSKCVLTKRRRG